MSTPAPESARSNQITSRPVLIDLCEVQPEPVRWLRGWENRVPLGKITIFAGDPGLGKSLVALEMAAQVTKGGKDVVILSAEDDPADTIRPRLDAADADVSRVHLLQAVRVTTGDGKHSDRMLRLDHDVEHVAEALRQYPETALVIIDPLSAYTGSSIDANRDEQVRSILAPLAALASKTGIAIVCIRHLNKAEDKSPIYRPGGSVSFVAAARVVWMFTKDKSDPERRLMLLAKSNIGPDPGGLAYRIEQTESGLQVKWEPDPVFIDLGDALRPATGGQGSVLDAAKSWLRELLSSGPMAAKEVQQAAVEAGLSRMTVRRAANALGITRKREGFGSDGHWIWSLPVIDAHPS